MKGRQTWKLQQEIQTTSIKQEERFFGSALFLKFDNLVVGPLSLVSPPVIPEADQEDTDHKEQRDLDQSPEEREYDLAKHEEYCESNAEEYEEN